MFACTIICILDTLIKNVANNIISRRQYSIKKYWKDLIFNDIQKFSFVLNEYIKFRAVFVRSTKPKPTVLSQTQF